MRDRPHSTPDFRHEKSPSRPWSPAANFLHPATAFSEYGLRPQSKSLSGCYSVPSTSFNGVVDVWRSRPEPQDSYERATWHISLTESDSIDPSDRTAGYSDQRPQIPEPTPPLSDNTGDSVLDDEPDEGIAVSGFLPITSEPELPDFLAAPALNDLQDRRAATMAVRMDNRERRVQLRIQREHLIEQDGLVLQHLNRILTMNDNPELREMVNLIESVTLAREELQKSEIEFNDMEDDLTRREFELKESEARAYANQMVPADTHSRTREQQVGHDNYSETEVDSQDTTLQRTPLELHLRQRYLSVKGDADLVWEQIHELRIRRAQIIEEKDARFQYYQQVDRERRHPFENDEEAARHRLYLDLDNESQDFLHNFDTEHDDLKSQLAHIELNLAHIQGVIDDHDDCLFQADQFLNLFHVDESIGTLLELPPDATFEPQLLPAFDSLSPGLARKTPLHKIFAVGSNGTPAGSLLSSSVDPFLDVQPSLYQDKADNPTTGSNPVSHTSNYVVPHEADLPSAESPRMEINPTKRVRSFLNSWFSLVLQQSRVHGIILSSCLEAIFGYLPQKTMALYLQELSYSPERNYKDRHELQEPCPDTSSRTTSLSPSALYRKGSITFEDRDRTPRPKSA